MKTKSFTLALVLVTQFIFAQITGIWYGDLDIQGMKLPLVINVKSENGGYNSVSYSPKQSPKPISVDQTNFANNDFSFKIEKLRADYSGKLQNGEITGNFNQNGRTFPLNLHKISDEEFKKMMDTDVKPIGNREIDTKKIDEYLNYIAQNKQGIGSVSIFHHGKEIYRKDFGQDQISATYNKDTEYQVGSISKLFTAVMLMQQVEKGKLKLTDKLSKFYPDMPNAGKITIENMMNHTSGLGDYVGEESSWLFGKPVGNKVILDKIKKEGVEFQAGEKTRYSNSAYFLLSRILEKIGKAPYNVLLKKNITDKVGMENTFSVLDNPKNIFKSYNFSSGKWQLQEDFDFHNAVGLGDITSTTTDLNFFINALFQNKLLKKETLEMMMPTKEAFGLGVMGVPFYNIKSYGHGGDTAGQHCFVAYNPADDFSVAMTINGERMPHNDISIGVLSEIYNQEYEFPKFSQFIATDLQKYSGDYVSKDLDLPIKIFVKDGQLFAQAKGQGEIPLEANSQTEFLYRNADVRIVFDNDKQFRLIQMGKTSKYVRK